MSGYDYGKESLKANLKKFLIAVMEEETKDGPINVVGQELLNELTAAVDKGFQNDNVTNAIGGSIAGSFKTQAVQNAIGQSFGPAVERAVAGAVATNLAGSTDDLARIIDTQKAEIYALRQELAAFKTQMGFGQPGAGTNVMSTLAHLQNTATANSENQRRIIKSLNDLGADVEEAQPVNPNGDAAYQKNEDRGGFLSGLGELTWKKVLALLSAIAILAFAVIFLLGLNYNQVDPEASAAHNAAPEAKKENKRQTEEAEAEKEVKAFAETKYKLLGENVKLGIALLQEKLKSEDIKTEFPTRWSVSTFNELSEKACKADTCEASEVWPSTPTDNEKRLRHTIAQAGLITLAETYGCESLLNGSFNVDGEFGEESITYTNKLMTCMFKEGAFRSSPPAESCIKNNTSSSDKAVCLLKRGGAGSTEDGLEAIVAWAIAEVGRSGASEK